MPRMMLAHRTKVAATMSTSPPSSHGFHVLEHIDGQLDAKRRQAVAALWTNPRRPKASAHLAIAPHAGSLEDEDVLHRDHVALHPGDLGDARHFSRPSGEP